MNAGELRHLIHCDEPVTGQSAAGEETVTFTEAFVVRGSISDLPKKFGMEGLHAGGILAGADAKVMLRWSPSTARITPKWRLRYGETIFDIKAVTADKYERRQIEIIAASGLNQG